MNRTVRFNEYGNADVLKIEIEIQRSDHLKLRWSDISSIMTP